MSGWDRHTKGITRAGTPLPEKPEGTYGDMFAATDKSRDKAQWLVDHGWSRVDVEPGSVNRFFEMKDWCDVHGQLGTDWVNVDLNIFIFKRKDIAALFKLTFYG